MTTDNQTIETNNKSEEKLAEYFKGVGPRTEHIELALELAGVSDGSGHVVEIGCGDARDAEEIIPRVASYIGFDPSTEMLRIARKRLPNTQFVLADSLSFEYPTQLDVVFAFASLIHSGPDTNRLAIARIKNALRVGGIAMINVRIRDVYSFETQTDQFGTRVYYYYTPELLAELAGPDFTIARESQFQIGTNTWLTLALRRAS